MVLGLWVVIWTRVVDPEPVAAAGFLVEQLDQQRRAAPVDTAPSPRPLEPLGPVMAPMPPPMRELDERRRDDPVLANMARPTQ